MIEPITKKLYKGKITIEFFDEWLNPKTKRINKHVYLVNGERYPISVTGVTGMLDKSAVMKRWAVEKTIEFLSQHAGEIITSEILEEAKKQHSIFLKDAAETGTLVHAWAEEYIKGKNPSMPENERVINGVTAFLKWVEEHEIKFLASELLIFSKKYGYIGLMDCKFTSGREDHKIIHAGDFKTSSGIYNEMRYQVSAYQSADEEESGCEYGDKWILRFDKKTGEFEAKSFSLSEHKKDFQAFLGLLATKRREDELNKVDN